MFLPNRMESLQSKPIAYYAECPKCAALIPKVKRKYKKRDPKVKPEVIPLEILKEDVIISFE